MPTMHFRATVVCASLAVLSLVAGACSGKRLPPMADASQARTALVLALDTWKSGQPVTDLAQRNPPVYFNDPRYSQDDRLVGYTIDDEPVAYGQSLRYTVQLQVRTKAGDTIDRRARYLIDTSPAAVIVLD